MWKNMKSSHPNQCECNLHDPFLLPHRVELNGHKGMHNRAAHGERSNDYTAREHNRRSSLCLFASLSFRLKVILLLMEERRGRGAFLYTAISLMNHFHWPTLHVCHICHIRRCITIHSTKPLFYSFEECLKSYPRIIIGLSLIKALLLHRAQWINFI